MNPFTFRLKSLARSLWAGGHRHLQKNGENPASNRVSHIAPKDYGCLHLRFSNPKTRLMAPDGLPLNLKDLFEHVLVFGGSGAGKTFHVLNQLLEGILRATHLPPGPDREHRKAGMLIIEAKGDFSAKIRWLAKKYDRTGDCLLFGPDHPDQQYDLFGDPDETPSMQAGKLLSMMKALNDGQKSQDPFWDNKARQLFLHLILLHQCVRQRHPDIEPMSCGLLNLLVMDKGAPRNAAAIETALQTRQTLRGQLLDALRALRITAEKLALELPPLEDRILRWSAKKAGGPDDFLQHSAAVCLQKLWQGEHSPLMGDTAPLTSRLEALSEKTTCYLNAAGHGSPPVSLPDLLEEATGIAEACRDALPALQLFELRTAHPRLSSPRPIISQLVSEARQVREIATAIENHPVPPPQYGRLQQLLCLYEQTLREDGSDPASDPLAEYFHEEYLNLANDKAAGSVGMVASAMTSLFVHPPFNRLFGSHPTFRMTDLIDHGKILVLDMPTAPHGRGAQLAAIALKIDFFRAVLSRSRLLVSGRHPDNAEPVRRRINQERPLFYFVDEFASVATCGTDTGEAGFLDKAREFRCGCILGLQNRPILLRRLGDKEAESIFSMAQTKLFMRNTDPETNEYAAKVLGSEIKVQASLNLSAAQHAFDNNKPAGSTPYSLTCTRGPRFDPGYFNSLANGEGILLLHPRFASRRIQQLAFAGHPIPCESKPG
ncbi:MAG: type IV secretion system DNA-binding domain-containing protein [Verrucomicrobiae bacterium]|nr:type IV secretion system DNA-binding domain-containing protein [Verrucomicrobiae bacterium]